MTRIYGNFINNSTPKTESWIERISPSHGHLVAKFAEGQADDIDMAVRAARAAFDTGPWPHMDAGDRASVLIRVASLVADNLERLAKIEVEEVGKPIRFARHDMQTVVALFNYAAGLAMQLHGLAYSSLGANRTGIVLREPVGVVGLIIPWNFPAETLAKKLPFALAVGCTCVVKPSELTSGPALELATLAMKAGLPTGVMNVVTGYGPVVGTALSEHPGVDMLSFTGSTRVGRQIIARAGGHLARSSVELGGKGATIVFQDADLDAAVDGALASVFFNQGECCVAGSRLLVQREIADKFIEKLVGKANALRVGDPFLETTDMGAMIHRQHLDRVLGCVDAARLAGAKQVCGDRMPPGESLFMRPVIFDHVEPSMPVFSDEIFGPVLSATRFDTPQEALALANQTDYALANSVWTSNIDTAMVFTKRLRSGIVWINTALDGALQLPFGGNQSSGFGRELGEAGIEEFTTLKSVLIQTGKRQPVFAP